MIRYSLLFLLPFTLFASKILSYNIYERTDRDDVMITFDTPYTGTIKQSISQYKIVIKLEGASIESIKNKQINSKYLHSLIVSPLQNSTNITASVAQGTKLIASKTADSYGLRLRFITATPPTVSSNKLIQKKLRPTDLSRLPTKAKTEISSNYYIVVTLLILAIIALMFFKKKLLMPQKNKKGNSWSFKSNQNAHTQTAMSSENNDAISIRFQKPIDNTNSVVMLDFGTQSYLVLMGNGNILLDKFDENKPKSQKEFESILQNRHEELERFLNTAEETHKEPLQAYKERAASLSYNEEL